MIHRLPTATCYFVFIFCRRLSSVIWCPSTGWAIKWHWLRLGVEFGPFWPPIPLCKWQCNSWKWLNMLTCSCGRPVFGKRRGELVRFSVDCVKRSSTGTTCILWVFVCPLPTLHDSRCFLVQGCQSLLNIMQLWLNGQTGWLWQLISTTYIQWRNMSKYIVETNWKDRLCHYAMNIHEDHEATYWDLYLIKDLFLSNDTKWKSCSHMETSLLEISGTLPPSSIMWVGSFMFIHTI